MNASSHTQDERILRDFMALLDTAPAAIAPATFDEVTRAIERLSVSSDVQPVADGASPSGHPSHSPDAPLAGAECLGPVPLPDREPLDAVVFFCLGATAWLVLAQVLARFGFVPPFP